MIAFATDPVSQALSGIAAGLREPVHIAAVIALALLAFEIGRIATEAWRRVRPGTLPLEEVATRAMAAPDQAEHIARAAPGPLSEQAVLDLAVATRSTSDDAIENALADYELPDPAAARPDAHARQGRPGAGTDGNPDSARPWPGGAGPGELQPTRE